MPPRTTRKSYRPRVSDRTMVDTVQPPCLLRQRPDDVVTPGEMNLRKWEHHGSSLQHTGWMPERISPLLPVAGEVFFLDIPLYRTRLSDKWFQMSDYPTCQELAAGGGALLNVAAVCNGQHDFPLRMSFCKITESFRRAAQRVTS